MRNACPFTKTRLQCGNFRPHNIGTMIKHRLESGFDLVTNAGLLGF